MPGDETKNYDFVIEVNEQGCDKIIGAFFNKSFILTDVSGDISTLVQAGDKITLLPGTRVNANFELAATVTDSAGKTTRACRYVDFVDAKTENVRLIRGWGIFREEFWNAFGDLQATG